MMDAIGEPHLFGVSHKVAKLFVISIATIMLNNFFYGATDA